MDNQLSIFDLIYPKYKITKPIRLIELFSGYGSQALALKYLGVPFKHWKTCEWAVKSIQAYKDIHFTDKFYWKNADDCTITKEILVDTLFNVGISSNYNEPMSKEQIQRLSHEQLVRIYENILITNNVVNIQGTKGKDLEIEDTDKYDYILTYSFPCQDLSLAGKGKGMSNTSTRSGMLWEVERILTECNELGNLPQILLMENVPQVHSEDNKQDFFKWQLRLEGFGYKNYVKDLIATDYGIPQTRNRCFMVSILGDYSYQFPKPIRLKLKLKDMLENGVDEKYYLSDKCIKTMLKHDTDYIPTGIVPTLTTELAHHTGKNFTPKIIREINYSLKIKNATKQGYLEAQDGDGIDISMGGENNGVVNNDLRIRKLTPRECFRLMGVKDEDYDKVCKNQSDSSLYHLAGDSIVVNVLMAIFKEMI